MARININQYYVQRKEQAEARDRARRGITYYNGEVYIGGDPSAYVGLEQVQKKVDEMFERGN